MNNNSISPPALFCVPAQHVASPGIPNLESPADNLYALKPSGNKTLSSLTGCELKFSAWMVIGQDWAPQLSLNQSWGQKDTVL